MFQEYSTKVCEWRILKYKIMSKVHTHYSCENEDKMWVKSWNHISIIMHSINIQIISNL